MVIKNRNLFRITRFVLLKLPKLFRFFARFQSPQKRLLIIKCDAIGDYILFRNFLEEVRLSKRFSGYRVDLVGNKLWQDIALKYDGDFVDNFFFIKPDDLYESPMQAFKLGFLLFRNNYETVLQPAFSRTFITDGLAGLAAARQIIGFESDTERISPKYKSKTDRFYTQRLPLPADNYFEFDRSKYFFENVLSEKVKIIQPSLPIEPKQRKGIILFPGAGVLKRGWEADKFLELAKRIIQHTDETIYLAGGPAEKQAGQYLTEHLPAGRVSNLTGQTTLPQLVDLIGSASVVIANETSAIHIAAATKTKAVCILGGGHFGRFTPYPDRMHDKPASVFEKMECYNCNWNCIYKTAENEPYPCISNVSLEKVWGEVLPLLNRR